MPLDEDHTQGSMHRIISQLNADVADRSTLLALLAAPLESLQLLAPQYRQLNNSGIVLMQSNVLKNISSIQKIILEKIAPTWLHELQLNTQHLLLDQYFCPDSFAFASPNARRVALDAYSTLLSLPLNEYSIYLLNRLIREYPIDRLYSLIFSGHSGYSSVKAMTVWEDCVQNLVSIPAKVANSLAGKHKLPESLEHGLFFNRLSLRVASLVDSFPPRIPEGTRFTCIDLVGSDTCDRDPISGHFPRRQACRRWSFPDHYVDITITAQLFRLHAIVHTTEDDCSIDAVPQYLA